MASDNKLLRGRTQRYEVRARNGQVIEHSITSQKKALEIIKSLKARYPEERFSIMGYDAGKYGTD